MPYKLGKKLPKFDERTFKLSKYVDSLPEPPEVCSYYKAVLSWGMMLNDLLGDCTCAGIGHAEQVASLNDDAGEMVTEPDSAIQDLYEKTCGYVPGDPSTDNGGVLLDVLNYIRKNKFGSHVVYAYAKPDTDNLKHVKQAINSFGVLYIGLGLPITAEDQIGNVWDVVENAGGRGDAYSWGGHCVVVSGYNQIGPVCITWGQLQQMTWAFFEKYCDEAYAVLFRIWMERCGGLLHLDQMEADLQSLNN